MSRFLDFTQEVDCWIVWSKKNSTKLGQIEYYIPWKKWVFWSYDKEFVFDVECLKDITKFMEDM